MKELVLGTVQLGLDYGINNISGKPNKSEAFDILDYALKNNIKLLDTAAAYGDSENVIGEYLKKRGNVFKIETKLPKIQTEEDIHKYIMNSIETLNISNIEHYLVHSFEEIMNNEKIIEILNMYVKKGIIKSIGISIYEPKELEYIIENLSELVSIVQIPFNILDKRWRKNNILERAKDSKIKIACRSVYLQGLFFASDEKIKSIHKEALYYINCIRNFAERKKIKLETLLLDYVKIQKEIDYILIGCETLEQLQNDIEVFKEKTQIIDSDIEELLELVSDVPDIIIDPRKWNNT